MVKVTLMWSWATTSFGITGVSFPPLGVTTLKLTGFAAEKHPADNGEGRAVRFKFAFQYCGEGEPWWTKTPAFPRESLTSLYLHFMG